MVNLLVAMALGVTLFQVWWSLGGRAPRGDPRREANLLAGVGDRHGLKPSANRWWRDELAVTGTIDGVLVRVETATRPGALGHDRVIRVLGHGIPSHVVARGQVLGFLGGDDVRTGDTTFDQAIHLQGDVLFLRTRLDRGGRAAVLQLVRTGGDVQGGQARVELAGTPTLAELSAAVDAVVGAASHLRAGPREESAGLSRLALSDPHPGVRRSALDTLRGLDRLAFRDAATRALQDRSPLVRAYAGAALVDGDVIRRVLGATTDAEALTTALLAVRAHQLPGCEGPIVALLDHEAGDVRLQAVRALGMVGTWQAYGPLQRVADTLFERADIRAAARDAVAAVRARGGAVEGGRLSLTEDAGPGAVGLVDRPGAGAVAVVPEGSEG